MKNKKGEALPLNVIIIAIIVIVVLVVVLLIFIGGIGGLQSKFQSKTDDAVLAARECESFCNNVRDETNPAIIKNSAYCTRSYRFDRNGDGKVDTDVNTGAVVNYYCSDSHKADNNAANSDSVGVSCPVTC